MDAIFMNSENSKTSEPYVLILNLNDKLDLYLLFMEKHKKLTQKNRMIGLNYLMSHIL